MIRVGAGAVAGVGVSGLVGACHGDAWPAPSGSPSPAPTPAALACGAGDLGPPARVAAVRGRDLAAMTRSALDAIGGMGAVVHEG
ncbi:MAG: hypothetical protein ACM3QU_01275, partial [Verrucomicrobiota bacterium]